MGGFEDPLLACTHLSRTFTVRQGVWHQTQGEVRAVNDVSLCVRRGETLGLVGESGCGKSTLGRMLVGLLPPSAGTITFAGHPLAGLSSQAARQASSPSQQARPEKSLSGRLQMIFQDPFSSLNPRLTIGRSIMEPLTVRGVSKTERQEQLFTMLKLVGLQPEHASRYPHEFSGGQRQRIAIARALITHPELIVCDEAVSALDASVQAQVLNLLRDAQQSFGLSYVFISHDLAVVGFMSDRVAVMYLGQIVEQAPREQLFRHAAHPYTQALIKSVPTHEPAQGHEVVFLQGEPPSPLAPPTGCCFHPRCPQAMPQCRLEAPVLQALNPHADPLSPETHQVRCHLYTAR